MSKVTFDGLNRIIRVNTGITYLSVQEDLYSASKEWLLDNAGFLPPFTDAIGNQALGGGKFAGQFYFLGNGWRIKPWEANHELTIDGNLFRDPDDPTPGLIISVPYSVLVNIRGTIEAQGIATGGSSIAPADIWSHPARSLSSSGNSAIAQSVWEFVLGSVAIVGSAGRYLRRLAAIHGLTNQSVTASETGRFTADSDVSQTIISNPNGSRTMSGSP